MGICGEARLLLSLVSPVVPSPLSMWLTLPFLLALMKSHFVTLSSVQR